MIGIAKKYKDKMGIKKEEMITRIIKKDNRINKELKEKYWYYIDN